MEPKSHLLTMRVSWLEATHNAPCFTQKPHTRQPEASKNAFLNIDVRTLTLVWQKSHLRNPKHRKRQILRRQWTWQGGRLMNSVNFVKCSHSISESAMIGSAMLCQYHNRPGFMLSLFHEMWAACEDEHCFSSLELAQGESSREPGGWGSQKRLQC